jgi:hypothetical protein
LMLLTAQILDCVRALDHVLSFFLRDELLGSEQR